MRGTKNDPTTLSLEWFQSPVTRTTGTIYQNVGGASPGGRWIEPFLGSGVVSQLVRQTLPQVNMIVGDQNPWLIAAHQHWFGGKTAPVEPSDVTLDQINKYRNMTDKDFAGLPDRERALRFMVCLYSAWGNRWATNDKGVFTTPLWTTGNRSDPETLLRRLNGVIGKTEFRPTDQFMTCSWADTAKLAKPGDLVFLDSPYPETMGYSTAWDLEDWSRMYLWVRNEAIPQGIHVLVCNPGTLGLLWDLILERNESVDMPNQGRSSKHRTEYIGYHGPWNSDQEDDNILTMFGK